MIVFLLWRHATLAPSHVLLTDGARCYKRMSSTLNLLHGVVNHSAGQFTGELRRGREVIQVHTGIIDQVWTGCKAFIPKQLGSQSELIEVYLRAFQWRYVNRLTLIRTKTINQLNLLRKRRRKQSAQTVLWWLSLGKQHFEEIHVRHHSEKEKKSKTTLNAYWFRQNLDKNDDEYATQAKFSLSYFDAMTHIMRAEPILNDVKFHIYNSRSKLHENTSEIWLFPKTPANFHIILCMLNKNA